MNARTCVLLLLILLSSTVSASGSGAIGRESGAYRAYITSAARDGLVELAPSPRPSIELPPAPAEWPSTFPLGTSDAPGGAKRADEQGFQFRYQYLAGGANTGTGWTTWEPGGTFAASYITQSVNEGVIPVFSYYMVRHSAPGNEMDEREGVLANLESDSTMRSIYNDLEVFFRSANLRADTPVVLHFEPDLWGFLQGQTRSDDATQIKVAVGSSGHPDLAAIPDSAAGLAQAVLRLRDRYAPSVLVAYHLSSWGTGVDPVYSDPSATELAKLVGRSAEFYHSLDASFDVAFAEMSDRDAGFKQHIYGDAGASWWDESDFARHRDFLGQFVSKSGLRVVLWQIPLGNTKMRSMNNTWNHFQDNKVEWLLGDAEFARLREYAEIGVIGLFFGRGADGATCACDSAGDGVTNPDPINGNTVIAKSADDDGGYFASRVAAFVAAVPVALP